MTLVSTTKAVMRRRLPSGVIQVRTLMAKELMAFQGWHFDDYDGERTEVPHSVLTDLAGNAFNSFACGIVLYAAIPAMFVDPCSG